jgi:hypothetical protein
MPAQTRSQMKDTLHNYNRTINQQSHNQSPKNLHAFEVAINDTSISSESLHHRSMAVLNEISQREMRQDSRLRLVAGLTAIGDPCASRVGYYTAAIRRTHNMDVTAFASFWKSEGGYKNRNSQPSQAIFNELIKRTTNLTDEAARVAAIKGAYE